eukprot:CAMPEP_0201703320 /NCGR_PEP_ID=MMETSP0578-20130828/39348_1 /ASSEMBLY_ACC=CAM_ASM_000663 /TAXON_ID=267565 /ORGANISM="Skeletonema grethea, Strain CCMP 1804" /LENGTH=404 /DNA_ID=CAMNT_0048191073 /DNA_START=119 /DNA_END=1333 /DNA_ORIENTATION=-
MNIRREKADHFISVIVKHRRVLFIICAATSLIISLFNDALYLIGGSNAMSKQEEPFVMCDRRTPLNYAIHPRMTERVSYSGDTFVPQWPTQKKLLLLRKDDYLFGHIGNQMNSLLHAYDYARDHQLELGTTFHGWVIGAIQFMGYESNDNKELRNEIRNELGITVIRNSTDLIGYDEVIQLSAKDLYFYKSPGENWEANMDFHIGILRRIFLRYNRALGYAHHGLRAINVCRSFDDLFHRSQSEIKYSVIHSRFMEGRAQFKLNQLAKTSGLTPKGALEMSPKYVRMILKPLGMLSHPIILFSDGQLPHVEEGLLKDPVIGPKLIVMGNKTSLTGPDTALAILSDVYIGNPASVTSGYIARSRFALGYGEEQTYMFRKEHHDKWISVCNAKCIWNPWVMNTNLV